MNIKKTETKTLDSFQLEFWLYDVNIKPTEYNDKNI